jgi:hypothetical protein
LLKGMLEIPNRFIESPLDRRFDSDRADRTLDDVLATHRAKSGLLRKRVRGARSDKQAITGAGQKLLFHESPKNRGARQGSSPNNRWACDDVNLRLRISRYSPRTGCTSSSSGEDGCNIEQGDVPTRNVTPCGKGGLDEVGAEAGKRPARSDSFRKAWNLKTIPSREAQASIKRGGACEPECGRLCKARANECALARAPRGEARRRSNNAGPLGPDDVF